MYTVCIYTCIYILRIYIYDFSLLLFNKIICLHYEDAIICELTVAFSVIPVLLE